MEASFFIILFFVAVGVFSLVNGLKSKEKPPISSEHKQNTFFKLDLVETGKFLAYQYIGENIKEHDFFCQVDCDRNGTYCYVLIDGRKARITMRLDQYQRKMLVGVIEKAKEWNEKARENQLEADKIISTITTQVSFEYDDDCYAFNNKDVNFKFFNDPSDVLGAKLMICSPAFKIESSILPASIIFVENHQFETALSILSEENIQSVLNERAEKKRIQDEILT